MTIYKATVGHTTYELSVLVDTSVGCKLTRRNSDGEQVTYFPKSLLDEWMKDEIKEVLHRVITGAIK